MGAFDLMFDHHGSIETLQASHHMGCGICRVLYEELMASAKNDLEMGNEEDAERPSDWGNGKVKNGLIASSTALLGVIHDTEEVGVFRLDFNLEWDFEELLRVSGGQPTNIVRRTFVLKQTGMKLRIRNSELTMLLFIADSPGAASSIPISGQTSSGEVFTLALSWITQCDQKCNPPCANPDPKWYPTRLIDIRHLKYISYLGTRTALQDFDKPMVKLVERLPDDPRKGFDVFRECSAYGHTNQANNLYVTLSHCWGQSQPYTLRQETADALKKGIEIWKLPKTFRDAITFASQLSNVGWIWIDSLCIYQGNTDTAKKDWLHEAALMQRVYQESYLNISATAALHSEMGLYSERDYRALWENEVSLNVDGIPGLALHKEEHTAQIGWGRKSPFASALPKPEGLRRCILIDTSHWDNLVNKAPANVRAWVLQERLLAPRVLHFCKGTIAWECSGFTRAEGHPTGVPRFQLQHDRILSDVPLKGFDPFEHGRVLRSIRLGETIEPDPHMPEKDLYGFELWARLVEMYSRMNLTMAKDKLIALSGIAQFMSTTILGSKENPARYVAGLWYKYLESQLLWRVEPTFVRANRTFRHPSRRLEGFRVPSFSWASVDAQNGVGDQPGSGITYGEVTDRDLLINFEEEPSGIVIRQQTGYDFDFLDCDHFIMLRGKLRKIWLSKGKRGRFYWRLLERNDIFSGIDEEKHTNVYLDAPDDDDRLHKIFDSDNVYCLPAAFGPRSEAKQSKYIFCLILQQADLYDQVRDLNRTEQKGTFRRIGLTKLSSWGDKHTYEHILTPHASDAELPQWPRGFDDKTKRHLIRII